MAAGSIGRRHRHSILSTDVHARISHMCGNHGASPTLHTNHQPRMKSSRRSLGSDKTQVGSNKPVLVRKAHSSPPCVSCRLAPLQPGHPPVFCERFQAWPSVDGITIPRSCRGHHTPVHGVTSLQPALTAFYQREPILPTKTTTDLKSNKASCCLFQMVTIFSHPRFASKDWNVVDQGSCKDSTWFNDKLSGSSVLTLSQGNYTPKD